MITPSDTSADEAAIRKLSDRQSAAVLAGDVGTLDELLADDFTATHITGYEQPKDEWLAQISSGQMQYHASTEVSWDVTIDGDTAVIESRSRVDATIYGSRRVWRWRPPLTFGRWTDGGSLRDRWRGPSSSEGERMSTFQRARTQEQRDERREHILAVARELLAERRVAEVGLNELARHVGLANTDPQADALTWDGRTRKQGQDGTPAKGAVPWGGVRI